ncbi:hypothetical protein ACWCP6_06715 [Streptomyces sp. NPDC002004]
MGIESDQLVFDYLSRVGDLAQQRQLASGVRMRLVAELRSEIEQRRATAGGDSAAAVRRILSRLGSPDEVVDAAGTGDGTPGDRAGSGERGDVPPSGRGGAPRGRRAVPSQRVAGPDVRSRPSPPHLAGMDELGPGGGREPDWWRAEGGPPGATDQVPGFVGGVEIPEILKPPPAAKDEEEADGTGEPVEAAVPDEEPVVAPAVRRRWFPGRAVVGGTRWTNPLLLLAAALLVAGALLGNLVALGAGWLIAWASRRLTVAESKWAVMGVPGLAAATGIGWLWGRMNGKWGEPIRQGHMADAIAGTWPWVLRGAAVGSALFLVWRSQRGRYPRG